MKTPNALGSVLKCGMLVLLLGLGVVASAQTYTVLFTYPQTSGGNTGILAPDVMSQGQDGAFYSTDAYYRRANDDHL